MEIVQIGDRVWDVLITGITESFAHLNGSNAGRTIAIGAPMILDPLGVFFSYKVEFARKKGYEEQYDELFDFLARPRADGIRVNIIHGQAPWDEPFMAYVSQGERTLKRIDPETEKVYWDKFSANIVPMEAQIKP